MLSAKWRASWALSLDWWLLDSVGYVSLRGFVISADMKWICHSCCFCALSVKQCFQKATAANCRKQHWSTSMLMPEGDAVTTREHLLSQCFCFLTSIPVSCVYFFTVSLPWLKEPWYSKTSSYKEFSLSGFVPTKSEHFFCSMTIHKSINLCWR